MKLNCISILTYILQLHYKVKSTCAVVKLDCTFFKLCHIKFLSWSLIFFYVLCPFVCKSVILSFCMWVWEFCFQRWALIHDLVGRLAVVTRVDCLPCWGLSSLCQYCCIVMYFLIRKNGVIAFRKRTWADLRDGEKWTQGKSRFTNLTLSGFVLCNSICSTKANAITLMKCYNFRVL